MSYLLFLEKNGKIYNGRLLNIVGGALWVNMFFSGIPLLTIWIQIVTVSLDLDLN